MFDSLLLFSENKVLVGNHIFSKSKKSVSNSDFPSYFDVDFLSTIDGVVLPVDLFTPSFDSTMQLDCAYRDRRGAIVTLSGDGSNLIEGVREKRDGHLVVVFSINSSNYAWVADSLRETDLYVGTYEFFNNKVYAFDSVSCFNKTVCNIGGVGYPLVYDDFLTLDSFLYRDYMEGVICLVRGKQFKWKECWTLDLRVDDVRGNTVNVLGSWIVVPEQCLIGDIIEVTTAPARFVKKRPDKCKAQSGDGIFSAAPFSACYDLVDHCFIGGPCRVAPRVYCSGCDGCGDGQVVREVHNFSRANNVRFYSPCCLDCGRGDKFTHTCAMFRLKGYCYCLQEGELYKPDDVGYTDSDVVEDCLPGVPLVSVLDIRAREETLTRSRFKLPFDIKSYVPIVKGMKVLVLNPSFNYDSNYFINWFRGMVDVYGNTKDFKRLYEQDYDILDLIIVFSVGIRIDFANIFDKMKKNAKLLHIGYNERGKKYFNFIAPVSGYVVVNPELSCFDGEVLFQNRLV